MNTSILSSGDSLRIEPELTCAAPSCWLEGQPVSVGEREAILCETHRKAFLGVSS